MPAFAAQIQWLDGTFKVQSLEVTREGGELLFRLAVGLARPVTVGGKTFNPDPRGQAISSTLVANVVLPTALFLAALFARPRNYLFRLGVAVPGVVLIATVGVPLTLLANLWRIVYEAANSADYSPLVFWSDFVQDGGVNFLAIGSGALLAYVIERVTRTKASTTPDQSGNGTSTCAGLAQRAFGCCLQPGREARVGRDDSAADGSKLIGHGPAGRRGHQAADAEQLRRAAIAHEDRTAGVAHGDYGLHSIAERRSTHSAISRRTVKVIEKKAAGVSARVDCGLQCVEDVLANAFDRRVCTHA